MKKKDNAKKNSNIITFVKLSIQNFHNLTKSISKTFFLINVDSAISNFTSLIVNNTYSRNYIKPVNAMSIHGICGTHREYNRFYKIINNTHDS